jgi:hypothetical protein
MAQHVGASQADALAIKVAHEEFSQSWSKHDPPAIAALFTRDSLLVTPNGIAVVPQEIASSFKEPPNKLMLGQV